jgi:carbamoyltransferase
MIDGEIVAAVQEERFTGLKGDYGYPEQSIDYCLKQAAVTSSELDEVILCTNNWNPVLMKIKRNANFSVDDWIKEQHEYWWPRLMENRQVNYYDLYKGRTDFDYDKTYPMDHLLSGYMDPAEMKEMTEIRLGTVSEKLNVSKDLISTVLHEDCHTYYAYFGSPMRGTVLSLTSEGIGDYSNGTVSIFSEAGRNELARTTDNHLGHIYQYITLLLGMKPAQHEYKVMGLAPYSNAKETEKSYEVFRNVLKVAGLNIVYDEKPEDLYFHFKKALEGHRFDGIAGAVQKFLEEILSKWVQRCIKETGLDTISFSGGVAQNIKAMKKLIELDELNNIYVCPAAGDTSLPLGGCYYAMWRYLREQNLPTNILKPLEHVYLGPEFSTDEISDFLQNHKIASKYGVVQNITADDIAGRLAEGQIIARCSGRMEFGLRALGNRSILADPRRPDTVRKINNAIKFRDFWMPFTPSILEERESDYIINPKNLKAPFMTMAFDSTPLARKELIAAIHPADFTVRPQLLKKSSNPGYYAILKAFEKLTGVGGVLNTSFNLHGAPIVLGPEEALSTFENSELDALILGQYLITRTKS